MNSGSVLEIEGLSLRYGERQVLNGFSMRLAPGEKVTVCGPSGVGKSTLLRCVIGLAVPQAGTVTVFGQRLDAVSVWTARRRMAYVAQEPDFGPGTARAALERPFSFRANASLRDNLTRIPEWMARFRLPADLLDKETAALSGGERQRLALVLALLLERPLWLLDEISSGLDPENRQTVIDAVARLDGVAVLAVSHDREWQAALPRTVAMAPPEPIRKAER